MNYAQKVFKSLITVTLKGNQNEQNLVK